MKSSLDSTFANSFDCTNGETIGLVEGTYYVRFKATSTTEASDYVVIYVRCNIVTIKDENGSTSIKYRSGTIVNVKVSIPIGKSFVRWIFEGITLSSEEVKKEEISFEMPENDITLTAIFDDVLYNITITNGKVNGELTQVKYQDDITALANEPETDKMFDKWIVTGISLTDEDLFNPNITFKMPSNDVVLEATYKDIPKYDVTVSGGSGAGKYKEGEAVTIVSEEKEGFSFDKWIVTGITLKDDELSSSIITFIMPAYYVVLEATYTKNITPEVKYKVIIVDGISSISESENGKTITIKANEAPKGFVFDKWVVISGNVKLEDQNNKETSFVKASEDVEIKATYRTKDSSGDDKPGEDKPGDDKPGENKGLSGGAIAGIVIGSVFACGIGGFSLVWFVIKKKSFADLGNSIKSIFNKIKSLFKKGKE